MLLLNIPKEIYDIIVSYLNYNDCVNMHTIIKPNYRHIFSINLSGVFKLLEIAKRKNPRFNAYSYKQMYYQILNSCPFDYMVKGLVNCDMNHIYRTMDIYEEYKLQYEWAYYLAEINL